MAYAELGADLWTFGDTLRIEYHTGHIAQRFSITGQFDASTNSQCAPFIEVNPGIPAYRPDLPGYDTGVGANYVDPISGYQLYRVGTGDTDDREFLAVEAFGNQAKYAMTVATSGTGQTRPFQFRMGSATVATMATNNDLQVNSRLTIGDDANSARSLMWGTGDFRAMEVRQFGANSNVARIFLSKDRATTLGQTAVAPNSGDTLGDVRFGHLDSSGERLGAAVRAVTTETWVAGVSHGTTLQMQVVPTGTTASVTAARFSEATNSLQTAMYLRCNRSGTKTLDAVTLGAADSGGTGYRVLRVPN